MGTTDPDLVKGCLEGDRGAWETIVFEYHRTVYNLVYRFTGRFDSAKDPGMKDKELWDGGALVGLGREGE